MKTNAFVKFVAVFCILLCTAFISCEKTINKEPEDVIMVNMICNQTDIVIFSQNENYEINFHIDNANNFVSNGYVTGPQHSGYMIEFASVGRVSCISDIQNIPNGGWNGKLAVIPSNGYVVRKCFDEHLQYTTNYQYARIYVVDYLLNTSGEIIGATVKYQTPWHIE
jgi:hypothetical protein